MAEKMTDVNRMIRELEEADIDDDGACVRYFPYKSDVPILVNALKMYRGFMAENKMEVVAALFGKELGERFTVRYDNCLFDCKFSECGFISYGAYDNPYLDFDTFLLQDLLVGRAVVVND